MHVQSLQSCPTLWDPMDCSLLASSVHGILQARILEWAAMPSSRGSFWPRDGTCISYVSCIGSCIGFFTTTATWEALALDGWDVYRRGNFTKPRLLQLLIHRKVLNSLTWDVCVIVCFLFIDIWYFTAWVFFLFFFSRNHYIYYFSLKQSSEKL